MIINSFLLKNHCAAFVFWFRMVSRYRKYSILGLISRYMYHRLSTKYGIQIPPKTKIGSGFYIAHGIGIIINGNTIIGENCTVSQFVTIGSNKGTPATIGNNVYIGPSVCIVEDVKIGNNVKIGAGTIVINDIPNNSTSVGNPNRIIQNK